LAKTISFHDPIIASSHSHALKRSPDHSAAHRDNVSQEEGVCGLTSISEKRLTVICCARLSTLGVFRMGIVTTRDTKLFIQFFILRRQLLLS
jgi:hypothetical protein